MASSNRTQGARNILAYSGGRDLGRLSAPNPGPMSAPFGAVVKEKEEGEGALFFFAWVGGDAGPWVLTVVGRIATFLGNVTKTVRSTGQDREREI